MKRRLLCYGDSNTHGTVPMKHLAQRERFDEHTRWTGHAKRILADEWELVEEGLPGRTTVHDDPIDGKHMNGLAHLPVALASHQPLDLVCILLGTNDCKARFNVAAMDILKSLGILAGSVARSDTGPDLSSPKVLIVLPPPLLEVEPFGESFNGAEAKSQRLIELASDHFAELNTPWIGAGDFMTVSEIDGIHYDQTGHKRLGEAIGRTIMAKFA